MQCPKCNCELSDKDIKPSLGETTQGEGVDILIICPECKVTLSASIPVPDFQNMDRCGNQAHTDK